MTLKHSDSISKRPPPPQQQQHVPSDISELEGDFLPGHDLMEGGDDLVDRDPPPPYGEFPDQLSFSQDNIDAGAAVTADGRVNIEINTKTQALAAALLSAPVSASEPLPPAYVPPSLGGDGKNPPPRLNVVIQIVGSRGDVQPFVALGQTLRDTYGHRIRIATHPVFQEFVQGAGLEFFSIGGDPAELMAFMVKNPGLLPGRDALRSGEIGKRRRAVEAMLTGCWRSVSEAGDGLGPAPKPHARDASDDQATCAYGAYGDPGARPFVADAIIANPPSFAHIHIAEKMGIHLHMMFTMPWSPTKAFPHPLANILSSNADDAITNYITYAMIEMMTWQGLGDVINRFREDELGLEALSLVWAPGLLTRLKIPYTYCWSPALIPKPHDWDHTVDVSGFYFLDLATDYTPDAELAAFLASGPPPVYIGFGSIVVDDPDKLTRLILDAIHLTGCRALVSQGWGGLGAEDVGLPDKVFMLGNVPHDWLFQRVAAVVHHGGAGTTAAGIKAGRPTTVIPFFGDQPFWGSMVARAGAGPEPIPYATLTADRLGAAIEYCLRPGTLQRAEELGAKIRQEKGVDVGGQSFHNHLDMDNMRCSVAPSRAAVWRVRRTKVRLGALTAEVLVRHNHLQYSDLKLYRSREYITEGQPWDPVTAVVSSVTTDLGSIFLGVMADVPRGAYKAASSRLKKETPPPRSGTRTPPEGGPSTQNFPAQTSSGQASSAIVELPTSPLIGKLPGESTATLATVSALTLPGSEEPRAATVESTRGLPGPGELRPKPSPKVVEDKEEKPDLKSNAADTFETAMETTRGMTNIIATGARTPMNFCLGLAKGFRNVPKLYNDDTVRPQEKVTDLATGLKLAGKEFGLGMYDGISGLITQPWQGARKEGGIGFVKGFGKGIGGVMFKPLGAICALPAYTMQGIHVSWRNAFAVSVQNYIVAARRAQGQEEYEASTVVERADIMARWNLCRPELRNHYKSRGKDKDVHHPPPNGKPRRLAAADENLSTVDRRTWFHRRKSSSLDDRTPVLGRSSTAPTNPAETGSETGSSSANTMAAAEDAEFERAIQASVAGTSRGNREEDAAVEQAIRSSVAQMRQNGQEMPSAVICSDPRAARAGQSISDEEYQALVQQAIQQSMAAAAAEETQQRRLEAQQAQELDRAIQESMASPCAQETGIDDEHFKRALEESHKMEELRRSHGADEEQLRKVFEESEKAHAREKAARTEEDVVLEYVMRQSMAEEEHRKAMMKGKAKEADGGEGEEDEDLKKAMEESLKVERSGGGQASGNR